ncbi:FAS-associated factor 2 [Schistocerca nitens]|uniref:FAS-associated factor 2 n=1 Tax=Schistocerca nitens TaxID=7011 RepID=UPI0021195444|nr:FAS-associated factor 2 [Schistocerca nitens]
MADLMSLSAEQTEKILQFQDLTGIEDMSVCRDVLQRHAWDLEVSVQEQLNMREGRPSVYSRDREPPDLVQSPPPVSESRISQFFFSTPAPARGSRGILSYIVSLFFRICYDTVATFLRFTFGFIRPDPRRYITDPVGDVLKFINSFEEKYGSRHPVFYQGTYSQALNDAKRELRFLLIYLHCEDHQDTDNFCRNTLSDMEVVTYINTNMLFWGCSVTTPEGYRVSQALRENGYPFLAVICLRENRMTVVGRLEGSVNPQELIQRLQTIVQENEAALIAARAERVERNFNQTLRQQQDQAYLESLRADEEKERRRCQERERLADEERSRREQEQAERNRLEEIRRQKVEFMNRIPDEPEKNHPDAVHIVIKLPDGTRLERRFLRSHTLDAVFYYIFCHPSSPVSFEVATNFPKRVLQCSPGAEGTAKQTLAEAGLIRREVLFVYDLDA